jgi:thioredoxin-dependent peroxiredoxin
MEGKRKRDGRDLGGNIMQASFKGSPVTLEGSLVREGAAAPDFTAVDQEFQEVKFSDYKDKVKVITSFLSLDTSTCDLQVKRFNTEAVNLSSEVRVIGISMDLPFAQKRFCEMNEIKNVDVVSDYRHRSFGENYGLLIKEFKLLARAVVIVKDELVSYVSVNREFSEEPDYEAALKALKKITG